MSVMTLINELSTKNIQLYLNDNNELKANAPKGVLTPDIIGRMKSNKAALIQLLLDAVQSNDKNSITAVADQECYDVSHAQNRLWVLDQIDNGQGVYNMPVAFTLQGQLDADVLSQSLQMIVQRHESLRTVFLSVDGTPKQKVLSAEQINITMSREDIRGQGDVMATARAMADADTTFAFDLQNGPLVKFHLCRLTDDSHLFLLNMHHIISDGWSMGVFYNELTTIYNGLVNKTSYELPALDIQYRDYADWHNAQTNGDEAEAHQKYWQQKLEEPIPVLDLPLDRPRGSVQTFVGNAAEFTLGSDLTHKLYRFSRENDVSLFIVLNAAIKVLLSKYSGNDDIILGTVSANRNQPSLESQIGFFVNTLALRDKIDNDDNFIRLLGKVRQSTLEAFSHQEYPFDSVVENIAADRDMSRSPVFDVMFVLQNTDTALPKTDNVQWQEFSRDYQISRYDLLFYMAETDQGICCKLSYNTDLFDDNTIERIYTHFSQLLSNLVDHPSRKLSLQNLLTPSEYHQLVHQFNDTNSDYPKQTSLSALFEAQVQNNPGAVALTYNDQTLSYHQLNYKANQLAATLVDKGVVSGDAVALLVERSVEMIVSILAVLKAGATFVPISPENPQDRINFIIQDAQAKLLVTQSALAEQFDFAVETLLADQPQSYSGHGENINVANGSDNIAHIIYTSGSTGKPKGVKTRQYSISRLIKNSNLIQLNSDDRVLQLSNYAFDGSTFDIFGSLLNGSELVLIDKSSITDIEKLGNIIREQQISVFFITTALFNTLVDIDIDCLKNVRKIAFGGELVSVKHCKKALAQLGPNKLIHVYGPTESTVFATYYPINHIDADSHNIPIGKPLSNTTALVLSKQRELLPVGVVGELYIGGDGLSAGYVNRPEFTAECFIPNPFMPGPFGAGRLYKTGDLVKQLQDGNIEFIGRIDNQVKIRGHRIELGEVDLALESLDGVAEVALATRKTLSEHHELIAYLVGHDLDVAKIHAQLAEKLPAYMVPSHFVVMDSLPLNANGKVDTKNLPCPKTFENEQYEPPATEREKHLGEVFCEILGLDSICINSNVFHLGFDSIKAIRTVSRLRALNYRIELKELFVHTTIKEMAIYLQEDNNSIVVDQGAVSGLVPLTPIQQWFFERDFADKHHFNQAVMLKCRDTLQVDAVKQTIEKLINHHDALRMTYADDGQLTRAQGLYSLEVCQLEASQVEAKATELQSSMSLENGPLIKLGIFQTVCEGKGEDHLLIAIHHLLIDGVSWRILQEDFATVYAQAKAGQPLTLADKTKSFKAWSENLAEYVDQIPAKEVDYWQSLATNTITELPQDHQADSDVFADSAQADFELSQDLTAQLVSDCHENYNTTVNDLLLSAFGLAVKDWTGNEQVWLNFEGHGREAVLGGVEVDRTLGWFTSLYPVCLEFGQNIELGYQIRHIKESIRSVPNNGVGYGILEYLGNQPLALQPQIGFNFHGDMGHGEFSDAKGDSQFSRSSLSTGEAFSANCQRINPLDVVGAIKNGKLTFAIHYNQKAYNADTMTTLMDGFKTRLVEIINHCTGTEQTLYSPSDFGEDLLSMDELDAISDSLFDL